MSLDGPTPEPLAKIHAPDNSLRWYNPATRCSVPCGGVFDAILAAHQDGRSPEDACRDDPAARAALDRLRSAGFFETATPTPAPARPCEWTLAPAAPRFLNAPDAPQASVGVLGAPIAFGPAAGVAQAPAYLRQLASSFLYQIDANTGAPLGFYDTATRRRVLDGLTIGDFGNLDTVEGADPRRVFAAIAEAARAAWQRCDMLVSLGGDHAVSPALVSAAPAPKLQVVMLDAHADTDVSPPGRHDKAAAAADLCALPTVDRVIQIGVRGYDDPHFAALDATMGPTLHRIAGTDPDRIRAELDSCLDTSLPWYVSLDLDVLDPQLTQGTQYPAPGGLTFDTLQRVLRHIGGRTRPVGADLVEVVPSEDQRGLTGHAAIMALFSLLDGWWSSHAGRA